MSRATEKDRLRAVVRERRRALDPAWVEASSRAAQAAMLALPEFRDAAAVGCYLALALEVQTGLIVERCWAAGKRVCVPAFCEDWQEYRFCRLDRGAAMAAGPVAVRQPAVLVPVPTAELGFVAVPGVAFDRAGHRLGRGRGHYDRLLAGVRPPRAGRAPWLVGLAFDFQVFGHVPVDAHDVGMDMLVTERETHQISVRRAD